MRRPEESENEWTLRVLKEAVESHRNNTFPQTLVPDEIDWLIDRLEEAWATVDELAKWKARAKELALVTECLAEDGHIICGGDTLCAACACDEGDS